MLKILLILVCFLSLRCELFGPRDEGDPGYQLSGHVVDSVSQSPISKALIGRRLPSIPDSLIFVGDSIDVSKLQSAWYSDSLGEFSMFWSEFRGSVNPNAFVAYKAGYRIWRYDQSPLPIAQIGSWEDTMTISLSLR